MAKFGFTLRKIKGRNFFYKYNTNNSFEIYNNLGIKVFGVRILGSLCSIHIWEGVYINRKYHNLLPEILYETIFRHTAKSAIVTFQNASKETYQQIKDLGFIDYARLPGLYSQNNKKEPVNSCISIMVYNGNKLFSKSAKKSIELLENLVANGENL